MQYKNTFEKLTERRDFMGHKRFNDTNDNLDDLADELGLPIAQMANFIVDNDSDKVL